MNSKKCPDCGKEIEIESKYCSYCGVEIHDSASGDTDNVKPGKKALNKKWILISALIILFSELLFAFIAGFFYTAFISSGDMTIDQLIIVSSIGSIAGIFIGSILSAYKSPGITIKEPAIGAAVIVLLSKAADTIVTGTFSLSAIAGMAIAYAIALSGAYLGEKLQNK